MFWFKLLTGSVSTLCGGRFLVCVYAYWISLMHIGKL